jgi:flagellar motor component MotA
MYFAGVFIAFLGMCLICLFALSIPIPMFINIPALSIIFLTLLSLVISTSNVRIFIKGIKTVIFAKYFMEDDEEYEKAYKLFKMLSKATLLVTIIPLSLGVISALGNLSDINVVTHGLATALIAPVIGLIIFLVVFEPIVYTLKNGKSKYLK